MNRPCRTTVFATLLAVSQIFCLSLVVLRADDPPKAEKTDAKQPPAADAVIANRPKVPGKLRLTTRRRIEIPKGSGQVMAISQSEDWNVSETAIIICDMWDNHYCLSCAQRVDTMAPRMNEVVTAARNHGVMIIHAPSGTLEHYAKLPQRLRMQQAKKATPPAPIKASCPLDPKKEPPLPIDDSHPCDDPVVAPMVKTFDKQHAAIKIIGFDGISDSGEEIYNFCQQEGIRNIVIMGVHTNMCVLGRSFGIRQMTALGMRVVLARDLTDAMYDPRMPPHVSHTRGTELVVEYIEKNWCPSISGDELTRIIPGSNGPAKPYAPAPATAKR